MTHRVDILVPTYNPNPDHLAQAIESVLAQTEENWQMVVHDDPSDADVEAMVKPYLHDDRISFQRSEKRLGIGGNWNACLASHVRRGESPSPYIQYLFQDDWWEPEYLRRALHVLETNPSASLVSVDHHYVFEGDIPTKNRYEELRQFKRENVKPGLHNGKEFLHWWMERGLHPNVIQEPSFVMIRRSALDRVGPFCEDMPQFLDTDMWVRLLGCGDVYFLHEDLGSFRVHPAGASLRNFEDGSGLSDRLHCFERLIERLHGRDRQAAFRARNRAVQGMVKRYFERRAKGMKVESKSKGALKKFVMRHPVVVGSAVLKVLEKKIIG